MVNKIPRVATIQDLSGYGRCALTVAIPILSVLGVQACPIPTAVLSTHMGGFGTPAFQDLTETVDEVLTHWEQIDLRFEALYSGFLANTHQIEQVKRLFTRFKKPGTLTLVDPVMGDKGKLYSIYTTCMQQAMKQLVQTADIVTPNKTELFLLLDEAYTEAPFEVETLKAYAKRMAAMGPQQVIIKGIELTTGGKVNAAYDATCDTFWMVSYEEIPRHYPGTGDAFASIIVGRLVKGIALQQAVQEATTFIRQCVETTREAGTDTRAGILFEAHLQDLCRLND